MIQVTKGMRDFYPEDYQLREWLFEIFRSASAKSGFELYDAPVVEAEELYIRKAGEEITEQLYTFEDKGGRRLALRPEMTPTLARMVIQRHKELPSPVKWAAIAQCFRYERMTRGRKREHYQWNLDYLGESSMMAELEILSTGIHALKTMGLSEHEVKVRISNRTLLSEVLEHCGVDSGDVMKVFLVIDKLGKVKDEALVDMMGEEGISSELAKKVLELVRINSLPDVRALLGEKADESKGLAEVEELFSHLDAYGYGEWMEFDFSIVRGLAYYTGTVFEFFDAGKSLRAIAGGGRYDHLIQTLADQDLPPKSKGKIAMPAVGMGFGDVVILELLKDRNMLPELPPRLDYSLIAFSDSEINYLLPLLRQIRESGKQGELAYPLQKVKKMMEKARKKGASYIILAGSEEREAGMIKLKSFETGEETSLKMEDFINQLS